MNEIRRETVRFGLRIMEILLVIFVILILLSLSIPAVRNGYGCGLMLREVSNARQIQMVTYAASLDRIVQKENSIGWPADVVPLINDNGGFVRMLLDGRYLKYGDLRIFGAGAFQSESGVNDFDARSDCGYKIYKVGEGDVPDTIFLTTRNVSWRNGTFEEDPETARQFKNGHSFVVFHKGGDGTFHMQHNARRSYGTMPAAGSAPLANEGVIASLSMSTNQKTNPK